MWKYCSHQKAKYRKSEIFDFREYVPGDDIRAIHWKLSGKTDSLILRQASDPSHYNVVLMADFGMNLNKEAVSDRELNAAAALCMAIGEQLVRCGVSFCLASPVNEHLHLWEITGEKELHNSFRYIYKKKAEWALNILIRNIWKNVLHAL